MKLGIDARPLQGETQYRGIGKALEFFLITLATSITANDSLIFYIDGGLPKPKLLSIFHGQRIIVIPTSRLGRAKYIRSMLPSFKPIKPETEDIDVLLQYDASLGIPTTVPTVTMFHDLIPLLFRPQEKRQLSRGLRKIKNASAREMYWRKYLRTLNLYRRASRIIAISESSKSDLLHHVRGISSKDISVVHLGVSPTLGNVKNVSLETKALAVKPYILYVGGIDLRKNVAELVRTFHVLKPLYPDLRLIAIGKEFSLHNQLREVDWFNAIAERPEYSKDIFAPGFVSGDNLAYLYSHALVFLFPSRYEGFGLPVLEAMQAGCPVIAYDNSSIPEVAGKAALLVKDGAPLAPAIKKVLEDKTLRDNLISRGRRQASQFTWDKTAQETVKILRKAC